MTVTQCLEGDIKSFDDRQAFLNDEIKSYQKIYDDLQTRHATAQKERQLEKNVRFESCVSGIRTVF